MADSNQPRRPLRSAAAFFAGVLTIVVLSTLTDLVMHECRVFPPEGQPMATGLWVLASAYRALFAIAGGWATARLAPSRPVAHAVALGCLGVVLSVLGVIATWDKGPGFGPKWYPISIVLTALPCTWAGARMVRPAATRASA